MCVYMYICMCVSMSKTEYIHSEKYAWVPSMFGRVSISTIIIFILNHYLSPSILPSLNHFLSFAYSPLFYIQCNSTCGKTYKYRTVSCLDIKLRNEVKSENCDPLKKPKMKRKCSYLKCHKYTIGKWSEVRRESYVNKYINSISILNISSDAKNRNTIVLL